MIIDSIYYFPFFINIFYLIVLFIKEKESKEKINLFFKKISHFIFVIIPLVIVLFILNFFVIIYYYLKNLALIILNKKTKNFPLIIIFWVVFGIFV